MLSKLELTLDCSDAAAMAEFWKLAVGYVEAPAASAVRDRAEWRAHVCDEDDGMRAAWLYDPRGIAPSPCLLEVPEPKTVKNRLRLDLVVSGDRPPEKQWQQVTDEVARLGRPCSPSSRGTTS